MWICVDPRLFLTVRTLRSLFSSSFSDTILYTLFCLYSSSTILFTFDTTVVLVMNELLSQDLLQRSSACPPVLVSVLVFICGIWLCRINHRIGFFTVIRNLIAIITFSSQSANNEHLLWGLKWSKHVPSDSCGCCGTTSLSCWLSSSTISDSS